MTTHEFTLQIGDYNSETETRRVLANGENIGDISVKDVPYLTRRSTDEIFLGRITTAIRKVFDIPQGEFITCDHYIDGHGYLAVRSLEKEEPKSQNGKKASSGETVQQKKEDLIFERGRKIVKGIAGKNVSYANADKIINEILHLAKVHLPFKQEIPTVNTAGKFDSVSEKSKNEKGDCEVRAIASVCDITYEEAHEYAKTKLKREDKKGTKTWNAEQEYDKNGVYGYKTRSMQYPNPNNSRTMGVWREYERDGYTEVCKSTVGSFIKDYPEGRYLVHVRNHAFCIVDGKVYGNPEDGVKMRTIVLNAWKVELPKKKKKSIREEIKQAQKELQKKGFNV